LGATLSNELSKASADLTYAYTWRWNTQPPQVWSGEIQALPWEMDPSAEIAQIFAGTARMKWRPWWPNYNYSNFIATARAPFNPMEYVFRSTGLVRGPHPFGFVVDDVRKDDQSRTYEWTAMLNGGVWRAAGVDIPRQVIALATSSQDEGVTSQGGKPAIEPQPGDPLLLIWPLGMDDAESAIERLEGPPGRKGEKQFYNRVVVRRHADVSRFRVLLLPMRFGAPLPKVTYDPNDQMARIIWPDHQVSLRFEIGADQRSSVNLATPPTP
jgi:hypothetical protein